MYWYCIKILQVGGVRRSGGIAAADILGHDREQVGECKISSPLDLNKSSGTLGDPMA